MVEVLHVYEEVEIVNEGERTLKEPPVVTISYDEKSEIQALVTPDLPPKPKQFASHLRDSNTSGIGNSIVAGWPRPPHRPGHRDRQRPPCQCGFIAYSASWMRAIHLKPGLASCSTTTRRTLQKRRKAG